MSIEGEFGGPRLGVLGGMGPMASAWFMVRLTALAQAGVDQEHIPTILWSDPRVPDRTAHYFGHGADPWPWLEHGLRALRSAGATAVAIPCNTAHLWYERMAAATDLPILHIVDAVVHDLLRQGVRAGTVGLLGTEATLQSGLYQSALANRGYVHIELTAEEQAQWPSRAIALVKANKIDEALAPAVQAVKLLQSRGAQAVVLGCTELPIALPAAHRSAFQMPIADSIDALAKDSIAWYQRAVESARTAR